MSRTKFLSMVAILAVSGAVSLAQAQGETPTKAVAATPAQTTAAPAKDHAYGAKHALIARLDLNSATREELMKLRGIDEATADKIIAARPFTSKRELVSKKVVAPKEFQMIASRVMVKQEALASSKTHK